MIHREPPADSWPTQLLTALGGEHCRDAHSGADGVWLPRQAWHNIAIDILAAAHDYAASTHGATDHRK
jgi:hypothetical protein